MIQRKAEKLHANASPRDDEELSGRGVNLAHAHPELELSANEQKDLLDVDLIGIFKVRGRIVTWANRGLERIFGYRPCELVNQPSRVLYVDDESYRATRNQRTRCFTEGSGTGRRCGCSARTARRSGPT